MANAWLALLGDRELLALTEQTLANQQDALRLTQAGFDGGNATALALRQAQTAVEDGAGEPRAIHAPAGAGYECAEPAGRNDGSANLLPSAPIDGYVVAEVPAGMDSPC
ncbi:TolC family protein [Roseococcus sp.]|uniref:TolC family protein n=1 Tax=Roseococcus sp. TaxID=2109646 RepID=UPI003BAD0813